MIRYAIHLKDPENPDYDGRRLSAHEMSEIETHLAECESCRNRLEDTGQEFQSMVDFVEDAGFANLSTHPEKAAPAGSYNGRAKIALNSIFAAPKIRLALTFALILLTLSSILYLQLNRHPYAKWAVIEKPDLEFQVRGRSEERLSNAVVHYQSGNLRQAISLFEQLIAEADSRQLYHFAHYYAGISYLLLSEKKIVGVTVDYQNDEVLAGIEHLQRVLNLTENRRYLEDVHWFLAKAYLRLADQNETLTELNKVLEFSGPRRSQAKEIIDNLSGM